MGHVQTSRLIPTTPESLFAFVADLQNLPEQLGGKIQVDFPVTVPELKPQVEFELSLTRLSVVTRFIGRVEQLAPGQKFSYRQVSGFFRAWSHVMLFDEHGKGQTRLTDIVEFTMPGGLLGALAEDLFVRRDIEQLLEFRYHKLTEHFEHTPGARA